MRRSVRLAVLILSAAAAPVGAAWAGVSAQATPFNLNYSITSPDYAVSDIAMFTRTTNFDNLGIDPQTLSYNTQGSFAVPASSSPTVLTLPFKQYGPVTDGFLMGVTSNLPGDSPGQQHLVLMTNTAFAAQTQYVAFGTLFPNTNETTLINDLELISSGHGDNQTTSDLYAFAGYATGDAYNGPGGSIALGPNDPLSVIAFSNKTLIGSGFSFTTPVAVPEPASAALLGIGILGLLAMRRRSSQPGA